MAFSGRKRGIKCVCVRARKGGSWTRLAVPERFTLKGQKNEHTWTCFLSLFELPLQNVHVLSNSLSRKSCWSSVCDESNKSREMERERERMGDGAGVRHRAQRIWLPLFAMWDHTKDKRFKSIQTLGPFMCVCWQQQHLLNTCAYHITCYWNRPDNLA